MRKWWVIPAVLPLVAILGGLGWLVLRPREPDVLYQGKPLTYWLQGFYPGPPAFTNGIAPPTYTEARSAVEHLGTNAIPTLLGMLGTPESPIKDRIFDLLRRQHYFRVRYAPLMRNHQAAQGFMALGKSASPAVPQLMRIYERHPSTVSQQIVPAILGDIGPAGRAAIPLLVGATTNDDPFVRNNSVHALGQIGVEPALAVPALARATEDPVDYVRAHAARSLGRFGTNARPAVPALLKLLAREQTNTTATTVSGAFYGNGDFDTAFGPNPKAAGPIGGMGSIDVYKAATNALKAIDPEAAKRAGVK